MRNKIWQEALRPEFSKPYFKSLTTFVQSEYSTYKCFPPAKDILAAIDELSPDDIKCVILGQDPYHGDGQANGHAFAVNKGVSIPPSLQNIYKELKHEYPRYRIPSHGDLSAWSGQGVLLLNAVLSVRAHQPASHAGHGWEEYTDAMLRVLNRLDKPIVYMLWGKYAQQKGSFLNNPKQLVLQTSHPSPYSASYGFMGCDHFKTCNEFLIKNNISPIDWQIPE